MTIGRLIHRHALLGARADIAPKVLERLLRPNYDDKMRAIEEGDRWLSEMASEVLRIVFPHRFRCRVFPRRR